MTSERTILLRCRVCGREEVASRHYGTPPDAEVEERTCGLHLSLERPGEFEVGNCSVRFLDAAGSALTPAPEGTDGE